MPQSAFFEEGSRDDQLKDLSSKAIYDQAWKTLETEAGLSGMAVANLAASFPFDLTKAAVSQENWEKGFTYLTPTELTGALPAAVPSLCRLGALTLTRSVLVVPRSAAAYQSSPFLAEGGFCASWTRADDRVVGWEQASDYYYYGAWDDLVKSFKYPFSHEPLMVTFPVLNAEPIHTDLFGVTHFDKWQQYESLEPLQSLAAHHLEKNPVAKKSLPPKKQARTQEGPKAPAPEDVLTDNVFKGVFGRLMTAINQGANVDEFQWDNYMEKAEAFVTAAEADAVVAQPPNTAFAPFSKFVLLHSAKAPPGWMNTLDSNVKTISDGSHATAKEWVESIQGLTLKAPKDTQSAKSKKGGKDKGGGGTKAAAAKGKGRGGGRGHGRGRGRGASAQGEDELLNTGSESEDLPEESSIKEKTNLTKAAHGKDVAKLKEKVTLLFHNELAARSATTGLSTEQKAMSAKQKELEGKQRELLGAQAVLSTKQNALEGKQNELTATVEGLSETLSVSSPEVAKLMQYNKEMVGLMSQLGTVINVLAPKPPTEDQQEQESAKDRFQRMSADAFFNGIINQVVNVYQWDNEKQKAFYSALKGIKQFDDALEELSKQN